MNTIGLYLNAEPNCGGTYTYNRLILEAALKSHQVCAVTSHDHWVDLFKQQNIPYQKVRIPVFWNALSKMFRVMRLPVGLYRFLAKWGHPLVRAMNGMKADVWVFPSQDAYSYLLPVTTVGVVHDLMHRYEPQFEEVGAPSIVKARDYLYANMCRYARGILVDSPAGKQQLMQCYQMAEQRVHVLPYCAVKKPIVISADQFYKKYTLPKKYLFYPAQFWRHKNHESLIKALHLLVESHPDIALVLVGSKKNAYESVKQKVTQYGLESHVHFLGFVPEEDLPSFYQNARALVMPTFFGPTNIPPLEAHLYDCPVVVSGIYGMPDQLKDAALFIDPTSVESIRAAIEVIWTDDEVCSQLICKGRKHALENGTDLFFQRFEKALSTMSNQLSGEQLLKTQPSRT